MTLMLAEENRVHCDRDLQYITVTFFSARKTEFLITKVSTCSSAKLTVSGLHVGKKKKELKVPHCETEKNHIKEDWISERNRIT